MIDQAAAPGVGQCAAMGRQPQQEPAPGQHSQIPTGLERVLMAQALDQVSIAECGLQPGCR